LKRGQISEIWSEKGQSGDPEYSHDLFRAEM